ncbi:hypothetical protein Hamer_G030662 [Homarus americanus]|uniref:Uncharacterized protein n=1 Tax=Homarus americanus TaxID=6706 RepID=A0A8J5MQE3_HOMAM|nr:hypothetical protein Hamer_G030662 [Homarus americanus]
MTHNTTRGLDIITNSDPNLVTHTKYKYTPDWLYLIPTKPCSRSIKTMRKVCWTRSGDVTETLHKTRPGCADSMPCHLGGTYTAPYHLRRAEHE